jgi:hypothetical protein
MTANTTNRCDNSVCPYFTLSDQLPSDRPIVAKVAARGLGDLGLVQALELALDEGGEPRAEQFHRLADTFLVGDGLRSRASPLLQTADSASSHSYAGCTRMPEGTSAGAPSRVSVSSRSRAPG